MARSKRPGSAETPPKAGRGERVAERYTHPDQTSPMRPDVGTESQFRKKKPPTTWRYDSSLSPSLDWDGLSPYYGWAIERLVEAIHPDTARGETPEVPRYETRRDPGSTADVDYWTSKEVREISKSHVNYVVADTRVWEQSAAYILDTHPLVDAFVKNAGLGFAVPYLHNGQTHDYLPDFIVRLGATPVVHLILETRGFDDLAEVKAQAAARWVAAVNADGQFGVRRYALPRSVQKVRTLLDEFART